MQIQVLILLTKKTKKGILSITASGTTGILLKETTTKITSPEGWFFDFFRPLMTAGLPLMNNVLTPLAKRVFTIKINRGTAAPVAAIQIFLDQV